MGLLDKLKNVFFEEEEIEVEEKPKKEKVKKEKPLIKKIETPKKEPKVEKPMETHVEEEQKEFSIEEEDDAIEILEEEEISRASDREFKFPVILDEEEPVQEEPITYQEEEYKEVKWDNTIYGDSDINTEVKYESDYHKEPYSNSYTRDLNAASYSLSQTKKEEKVFKPSPVISPVYGVLDLNYTKDEIKEKNKVEREPVFSFSSTKLDLDDVRAKAFGLPTEVSSDIASEIEDDIEEDDIDIDLDQEEADETIDMTNTDKPVVDSVTVGDAEEYFEDLGLEYNVDYKDSKKKKSKKKDEVEEESEEEDLPTITDKPKRKRSKEDEEENDIDVDIEDNLFDLIDSMYDEGE